MKFRVGDRFGKLEIVSAAAGEYKLLCSCDTLFTRPVGSFDKEHQRPRQCRKCSKDSYNIKLDTSAKSDSLSIRDYTQSEADMIKEFQDGNTRAS